MSPQAQGRRRRPAAVAGGSILVNAGTIVQTPTGRLDASGARGGVALNATQDLSVSGSVVAAAIAAPAGDTLMPLADLAAAVAPTTGSAGYGGHITLSAGHDITLLLGSSRRGHGGTLDVTAGGDISQQGGSFFDGYSAITVGGASTFTANKSSAQITLKLGSTDPFGPQPRSIEQLRRRHRTAHWRHRHGQQSDAAEHYHPW